MPDVAEVVKNDHHLRHLYATTTHDGTGKGTWGTTDTRIICGNTLSFALGGKGLKAEFVHKNGARAQMTEAAEFMKAALANAEITLERFRELTKRELEDAAAMEFFTQVFPDKHRKATAEEIAQHEGAGRVAIANLYRTVGIPDPKPREARLKCLELYEGAGMGSDMKGVRGTAYGAVCAVTEYVDHHSFSPKSTKETIMHKAVLGSGNELKVRALEIAERLCAN
jgi:hypothetical protein